MLNATLALAEKYDYHAEKFRIAYAFLRRADLAALPPGSSIPLDAGVVAQIQEYTTLPPEEARYEAHNRHFDIHFLLSGSEHFALTPRDSLTPHTPYDAENDIIFFTDPPQTRSQSQILLRPGDLVIVPPEDAHKPRIAPETPSTIRKIVLKIPT